MAKSKWEQVKQKLPLVEKWCRDGLTEDQIAKNLGISRSTLSEYKLKHEDLSDALKRGKEVFITEIENALAKKALGFYYDEKKTYVKYEDGKETKYTEISEKYQPPDVAACSLLLKNKDKGNWSDNPMKLMLEREMAEFRKEIERMKIW
jgi:transcriptional regulator with XRE-family HTH domain